MTVKSIEKVCKNIDRIDEQIIKLISERGHYIKQAARFKIATNDVKVLVCVEQVISKAVAGNFDANQAVTKQGLQGNDRWLY